MRNRRLFQYLIGESITKIYRVRINDTEEHGEDIELSDIVVFSAESGLLFEFIIGQASSETILLTDRTQIVPSFELDENEICQLYESDREKDCCKLPFTAWSITELWAGPDKNKFLAGVIFWDENRKPLLSLHTEGDDTDILPFEKMKRHITRMKADYSGIKEFSYGIPGKITSLPEPDQTGPERHPKIRHPHLAESVHR